MKTRTTWTEEQTRSLFTLYPTHSGWEIAKILGKTKAAVMMRAIKYGLKKPPDFKVKQPPESTLDKIKRQTGKPHGPMSAEQRLLISKVKREKYGSKYLDPRKKSRKHVEYKLWREGVFKRDDYTCQFCGTRGGSIQADHIKPYALYPELCYELKNGRTLCVDCHKQTPTYGKRKSALLELADRGATF